MDTFGFSNFPQSLSSFIIVNAFLLCARKSRNTFSRTRLLEAQVPEMYEEMDMSLLAAFRYWLSIATCQFLVLEKRVMNIWSERNDFIGSLSLM